jgi:uncharacterized protein with von Willebrand factor type A (vWA) domain
VATSSVWSTKPGDMADRRDVSTIRLLVAFARSLRRAGVAVPVDSVVQYVRAIEAMGIDRRDPVYWAGRTVLIHRHEDVGTYDQVFDSFWWGSSMWSGPPPPSPEDLADKEGHDEADSRSNESEPLRRLALASYSDADQLRRKDFAACTPEELEEISRLLRETRVRATQRSRRMRRSRRDHGRHDTRATMRQTLRSGGEVARLMHREPTSRPRRVVLLCDVSGSMEPYARALLRFLHVAVAARGRVEAFAVGTRLTRLTRQLSSRDPDAALREAIERVLDWSGGTRLGEGIGTFNDRFGMPGMARGAIVVILSDGLDQGDPTLLAGEMARLHRAAHQTIWVNPLKASAGYEPLARGMAAALPHVDQFVEGHSAASLDALVGVIAESG